MDNKIHKTPEHISWRSMHERCRNPKRHNFHRYGGRGIKVCERWEVFKNFLLDMGPRPDGFTLDRIDSNGDYEPSNCKWSSHAEQSQNRSQFRTNRTTGITTRRAKDRTGEVYNRLTLVSFSYRTPKRTYWNALCECGVTCEVDVNSARRGHTKSCGCLQKENQKRGGR